MKKTIHNQCEHSGLSLENVLIHLKKQTFSELIWIRYQELRSVLYIEGSPSVLHISMGFDKDVVSCIHRYSIRQFHYPVLHQPLHPLPLSQTSGNHPSVLLSLQFRPFRFYNWNQTVCSICRLASFTYNTHLWFFLIFL